MGSVALRPMIAPVLRRSRLFRSLVLTTCVFSFLAWLYVATRIIVNGIDPPDPFLNSVPGVSFSAVGIFAFGVGFISMFLYLWLWGRFGRPAPAA